MVYDSKSGKVLLFGGTGSETFFNDTWQYDPASNTWTDLAPAGDVPQGGSAASMVYDSDRGKIILFGGGSGQASFDDTWAYDPATNTWTDLVPPGSVPSARVGHGMVYNAADGTVILYGGRDEDGFLSDTWSYNVASNTWALIETAGGTPTERYGHAMVYDAADNKVLALGGWDGNMYLISTWVYDPGAKTWTSLDTLGDLPPPRAGHSVVYDSSIAKLVLFGGTNGEGFFSDARTYDPAANTWAMLDIGDPRPTARNGHTMVYDPAGDAVILFGGWDGSTYYNDTWSLGSGS